MFSSVPGPIGIFDSGYGGLTIFDKIRAAMPVLPMVRVRSKSCIVLQSRLWRRFSMRDASL